MAQSFGLAFALARLPRTSPKGLAPWGSSECHGNLRAASRCDVVKTINELEIAGVSPFRRATRKPPSPARPPPRGDRRGHDRLAARVAQRPPDHHVRPHVPAPASRARDEAHVAARVRLVAP